MSYAPARKVYSHTETLCPSLIWDSALFEQFERVVHWMHMIVVGIIFHIEVSNILLKFISQFIRR